MPVIPKLGVTEAKAAPKPIIVDALVEQYPGLERQITGARGRGA